MRGNDVALSTLEDLEKRFFAYVVFSAKIITWAALLALAVIVEGTLVIKVAQVEFSALAAHAKLSPSTAIPTTPFVSRQDVPTR
jgi:hypothetical protein